MRVTCHGGPYHGAVVEVPDGNNHFHIQEPVFPENPQPDDIIQVRTGTYSKVAGYRTDFEWDGWVGH